MKNTLVIVLIISAFLLLGIFIIEDFNPTGLDRYYWVLVFPAIGFIYTAYHITNIESNKKIKSFRFKKK